MALTRAMVKEILSAAGVDSEHLSVALEKIIEGNGATVDALNEEIAKYKADAEKLADVQKELNDLKEKSKGSGDWQKKYTDEHQAFEDYKKTVANEKATEQKKSLYRELLKQNNVEEKRIDSILKVTDLDSIVVKDDKIDNEDTLTDVIKKEWSGFIVQEQSKGAKVDNPPKKGELNDFEKMSLAEKMAYANEHPTEQTVIDWLKK